MAALARAVGVGAPAPARTRLPPAPPPRLSLRARAGLAADLTLAPGLREFWYPAAFAADVAAAGRRRGRGRGAAVELFGEAWVIREGPAGALTCTPAAASAVHQRPSLPTAARDGLVWVWPGAGPPPPGDASRPPAYGATPPGFTVHAELVLDVPCDAALLLENLLDLAHAPFTHTGTFAKGWPVPDAVRFHAASAAAAAAAVNPMAGTWDPYPIAMAHAPPAGVLSTIGLYRPGVVAGGGGGGGGAAPARHLHQLHAVLPAGPGRSRLLYRMAMDFWPAARFLPGIGAFWRHIAGRVLGEDLRLVAGQQDRLARGGDVWGTPVPYDKLAVRCRRWRNAAAGGDGGAIAAARAGGVGGLMSAGELLFAEEEGEGEEESE